MRLSVCRLVASLLLTACTATVPPSPQAVAEPYVPPSGVIQPQYRAPTQADVDRAIAVRDKFVEHYNANRFHAAYSQIKPLAASDNPIARRDYRVWQKVFVNAGDVMLMQYVAAYVEDIELFSFVSEELAFSSNICVSALAKAGRERWSTLTLWVKCYLSNAKQRGMCITIQRDLQRTIPEIAGPLGEPSGVCR